MLMRSGCGLLSLALVVGLLSPAPARQGKKAAPKAKLILVNDRAELFSAAAVRLADEKVKDIQQKYNKTLAIETYKSAPEGKRAKEGITSWAKGRYNDLGVKGVYILICDDPKTLRVRVGTNTLKRAFTQTDVEELAKKMVAQLKEGKRDEALAVATDFVHARLEANLKAAPPK